MLELAIEAIDFPNAWVALCKTIAFEGDERVIGGGQERKTIKDAVTITVLREQACQQVLQKVIHSKNPFKRVDEYLNEFTRIWLLEYYTRPKKEQFVYTYIDRLTSEILFSMDQLHVLKEELATQMKEVITSNRVQAITWIPSMDCYSRTPPCLQRVVVRYLGKYEVDLHLTWRSRDCYNAWAVNVVALADCINREVVQPNNCRIVRIVDFNDSLHVYKGDWAQAKKLEYETSPPYFQSGVIIHKMEDD